MHGDDQEIDMRELHPTPYRTHISAHDFETAAKFAKAAKGYPASAVEYEALVRGRRYSLCPPFFLKRETRQRQSRREGQGERG